MTKNLPYLALDSAGERTILCDYGLPLAGGNVTTKKETKKMRTTFDGAKYGRLFAQDMRAANRYLAQCHGRNIAADAAMDDETVEKLKGFLKNKLTAEDHEQVCNMLAGDVEAQDTEPPPVDPEAEPTGKLAKAGDKLPRTAADAKSVADFHARFPGLAAIKIDNSGLQPRRRSASYSDVAAKSFCERFPSLAHIKLA
jgi:hypothetical protein